MIPPKQTIEEEYAAAHEAVGLADLSHWAKVRFTGPDRKKFLNGLLTNDIAALKPLSGCSACLLTPKGKLLADLELYDRGEDILVLISGPALGNFSAAISRKIVLSETKMEDVGESTALFYLVGPQAPAVLAEVFRISSRFEAATVCPILWNGAALHVMAYRRLAPEGFLIVSPAARAPALWDELLRAGASRKIKAVSREVLNIIRVERGVPLFGTDMNTDSIPLEVGLEGSISFTKGCYMGQEVICRIKNLGHVNKILVGLKVSGREVPASGEAVLLPDKDIGQVSSAVWSLKMGSVLALAVIREAESRPGAKVLVNFADGVREAEVVALG